MAVNNTKNIITPNNVSFWKDIKEVGGFKDLIILFVKRDFIKDFKQTILGPIWFFIQPIMTTFIYIVVFSNIAGISTDGKPQILFYLSGIVLWNYFSDVVLKTSDTFITNANIFGKVYFPRLVVPISICISSLLKFGVQFSLFIIAIFYYVIFENYALDNVLLIFTFPITIVIVAMLSLGLGLIIAALTSKYRDLKFMIQFGIQLLMYTTPIVYPLSTIDPEHRWISLLNPLTPVIEYFKHIFLGSGGFEYWPWLTYSFGIGFLGLLISTRVFIGTERKFIDTV